MPLCVHCGTIATSLHATYGPSNIVCTACSECQRSADPYLEHDFILVILDLILVKPRAYRHLLFNGKAQDDAQNSSHPLRRHGISHWSALARRLAAVLLIDAYIRWFALCAQPAAEGTGALSSQRGTTPLLAVARTFLPHSPWLSLSDSVSLSDVRPIVGSYLLVLCATAIDVLTLHSVTFMLVILYRGATSCLKRLRFRYASPSRLLSMPSTPPIEGPPQTPITPTSTSFASRMDNFIVGDGADALFESHLVPSALLLSSLTPLFLLLLNLLWESKMPRADKAAATAENALSATRHTIPHLSAPTWRDFSFSANGSFASHMAVILELGVHLYQSMVVEIEQTLQFFTMEWAIRNLIGGVSSGVALAVLMPTQPLATVLFLSAGWYAQMLVRFHLQFPLAGAASDNRHAWCPV